MLTTFLCNINIHYQQAYRSQFASDFMWVHKCVMNALIIVNNSSYKKFIDNA